MVLWNQSWKGATKGGTERTGKGYVEGQWNRSSQGLWLLLETWRQSTERRRKEYFKKEIRIEKQKEKEHLVFYSRKVWVTVLFSLLCSDSCWSILALFYFHARRLPEACWQRQVFTACSANSKKHKESQAMLGSVTHLGNVGAFWPSKSGKFKPCLTRYINGHCHSRSTLICTSFSAKNRRAALCAIIIV